MYDRDRFNKFTERARRVLSLAREEARRLQHNFIGTEHLLLGLVREGDGVAAKVLSNLGVELGKVREAVESIVGRGNSPDDSLIGLTPRAKKVIELAVDEARRLNHHYIGTEHLLLGILLEGEGIAAKILQRMKVNLDGLRTQTIQVLSRVEARSTFGHQQETQTGSIGRFVPFTETNPPSAHAGSRDRFNKFTERARKALYLAQQEAQRLQNNSIGTEHLLLGLTCLDSGVAVQVLSKLGLEGTQIRSTVESMMASSTTHSTSKEFGLAPHAKKAIELAVDEARYMNHHYIGTEHLLLGLIREGDGIAAEVLRSLGVSLEKVRIETIRVLYPESQAGTQTPAQESEHSVQAPEDDGSQESPQED